MHAAGRAQSEWLRSRNQLKRRLENEPTIERKPPEGILAPNLSVARTLSDHLSVPRRAGLNIAFGQIIRALQGLQVLELISTSFGDRLPVVNFPTELAIRNSVKVFKHQSAEAINSERWKFLADRCRLPNRSDNALLERLASGICAPVS